MPEIRASTGGFAAFPVEPLDEHNRKLLDNVHPAEWSNPAPAGRYHLVVVGAGTAGLVSAAGAAGLGARVALVERHLMGGDCLNVGCVPSKAVIRAARAWQEAREASEKFGGPATVGAENFATAMRRMRRLRAGISPHDSARRFRDELGIDVFLGEGRFVAPDALEVGSARLAFRRAVIATGARAAVADVPGLEDVDYRTNETIFNLTDLPRRLAVIGGGPIGCEMAQAFARFGSQVILLHRGSHVLAREDADAAAIVQDAMIRDGVRLESEAMLLEVRRPGGGSGDKIVVFERGGERRQVVVEEILVAAGRCPNIEGLGLEAAGVRYSAKGVEVDDRLRSSNPDIFACGDVASRHQFTHVADAQARIVIQNALFMGKAKASALTIPWCTFTSPEIAHVGLYERDARARGHAVASLTVPLAEVDRAILDGEEEGFLRVVHETGSGKILGATLVAEHAGDMLGELCLAVTAGIALGRLAGVIHPYPTQAEVVKKAADIWRRGKLTPMVKRLFRLWFRLFPPGWFHRRPAQAKG
ncbi:MAG TPA: mercuric reductase [Thermoanaerobaculia bacterium]|nr:mercuric reductase [Thermoanaerobaculia bacterium]